MWLLCQYLFPNVNFIVHVAARGFVVKDTDFCLLACGGHPLSPPIDSPDNIAHIKGITYLSDYGVIMVCLGGAKKRAIIY